MSLQVSISDATQAQFLSLVMTSEERVSAIENDRADATLDNVGVEFDVSVVEEADEPFPMVQTITKFVGDPGLAGDARQLMLEPGLNAMTSGLLFSWRTRRRSSALAPLIVFSIA